MIDLKQCSLGIELGSTRIKAVLVGDTCKPVAQGDFTWENRLENGRVAGARFVIALPRGEPPRSDGSEAVLAEAGKQPGAEDDKDLP